MKWKKGLTHRIWTAVLCAGAAGCASVEVEPVGGGYQMVTYTRSSFSEPQSHLTLLQYRKPDTRWLRGSAVTIWPSTHGCVAKNDVAIFVGEVTLKKPKPGERWPMKERLFAERFPEPPVDITDALVGRWAQRSGRDVVKATAMATLVYFEKRNDALDFHFIFWATERWPDAVITLDWNQVPGMMRDAKEKGVARKDLRWGMTYVEKELKPDAEK